MFYRFANCVLDKGCRELTVGGSPVHLEPQVYEVLLYLLENRDRVVSRDDLVNAVWRGRVVSEATISARIFAARHAVGDTGEMQAIIRTLPRCGFRFVSSVVVDPTGQGETVASHTLESSTRAETHSNPKFIDGGNLAAQGRWSTSALIVLLLAGATGTWLIYGNRADEDVPRSRSGQPSIAVTPFKSFSRQEEQRFLAEGVAEDIITELSRNSDIAVMARSAAFAFGPRGLSGSEIAEELGVRYVLEGSVRRAGEELRISAQLVDGDSGKQLWANHYRTTAPLLYKTQDNIVQNIVGTLLSEVRETEKRTVLRRPPSNLDVYELALRGLARKHRLNAKDSRLAWNDLQRAVGIDPHYAPAWLYLGWVESLASAYGWMDDANLERAIGNIQKAIELDPTLAAAYQALSIARGFAGDADGALDSARRSVELGPGDADNLISFGRALATNGEFSQAVAHTRRALDLNPSRPSYYSYNLGRALWGKGELREAARLMDECLTKTPGFTACSVFRIAAEFALGNSEQASKALTALRAHSPDFSIEDALRSAGFAGHPPANQKLAAQLAAAGLPAEEKPKVQPDESKLSWGAERASAGGLPSR